MATQDTITVWEALEGLDIDWGSSGPTTSRIGLFFNKDDAIEAAKDKGSWGVGDGEVKPVYVFGSLASFSPALAKKRDERLAKEAELKRIAEIAAEEQRIKVNTAISKLSTDELDAIRNWLTS